MTTTQRFLNRMALAVALLGTLALLVQVGMSAPVHPIREASPVASPSAQVPSAQTSPVRLSKTSPVNGISPDLTNLPPADELPSCLVEDGSHPLDAPVCRWNGAEDGNGRGLSYVVFTSANGAQTFVYDSGDVAYEPALDER